MSKAGLVLASTSRFRAELLTEFQIPFVAAAPDVNEGEVKAEGLSPFDLVSKLSYLKAHSLRQQFPQQWILGSDQAAVFQGEVLSKPGDRETNIKQLQTLQGQTHQLMTGAYLLAPPGEGSIQLMEVAQLTMRPLTLAEIESYVDRDQPWDCAGGYKFEASGHQLFDKVEAEDFKAIQGLPIEQIAHWWRKL